MHSDLDHLPLSKQQELELVVRILFQEFEASLKSATQPWKKAARILKIVLYGSYARGDWVDDPIGGYSSDYDVMVIVNDERLTDLVDYWSSAEDRLMRELTIGKTITAPVNFVVHSLTDVNNQLEYGRPFFADIVKQGVALYEAGGYCFTSPRHLPPEATRLEATKYFECWWPKIETGVRTFELQSAEGDTEAWRKEAVFTLHQTVERLYHCALLVLTLYSPKSHKLNFLRSLAENVEPRLIEAWPRSTKFERRCFELLRQAYVNARYSPQYKISTEELGWLGRRVRALKLLVENACKERIA